MTEIVLDRSFRPWQYGIGHSQLLLHSRASGDETEHLGVLFVDVRAVKLRTSYRPLTLITASGDVRERILAYAGLPERWYDRYLCVTLPTEDDGFICCAVASVLATPRTDDKPLPGRPDWRPADARFLHQIRQGLTAAD